MKKLAFIANCHHHQHHTHAECHVTEHYVADLLSKNLKHYGFETELSTDAETLSVTVDDRAVAMGIKCCAQDKHGMLQCEISAQSDASQDWFSKIATQSVVKQLAQAMESSLKTDPSLALFQWKD